MSELSDIASSAAKALQLKSNAHGIDEDETGWNDGFLPLWGDGSNVFGDPWFRLCTLWLVEHDYAVWFGKRGEEHCAFRGPQEHQGCALRCPAEEFPARAIAALTKAAP